MTFVYVDEHGFVRSSEDNRILGVKTGDTQDGHIAYIANGVVSGEGVDLSKVNPVYVKPLPRITPEIAAMVRQVMAGRDVYPSEDHRLKEAIVQALWAAMEDDA